MTAWVIPIGEEFPDHWAIARNHHAWDLTRRTPIVAGDDVIFWLGGASVVSWVRASSSPVAPVPSRPAIPWRDRQVARYVARFGFNTVSDRPVSQPRWAEVQRRTGTASALNRGPVRIDSETGAKYLRSLFNPRSSALAPPKPTRTVVPVRSDVALPLSDVQYQHSETDTRRKVLSAVAQRRGQEGFRAGLIAAYGGQCAVTGSRVLAVLEAAHIDSYAGAHTQHVSNGLLLRADVHTLFDLHLLTVTRGLLLAVSPELKGSEYMTYDRRRVRLPAESAQRPDRQALGRHRNRCTWFSSTRAPAS